MGYGGALVYVFTTAVHTSILGALLTFARTPWYAPYSEHGAAVESDCARRSTTRRPDHVDPCRNPSTRGFPDSSRQMDEAIARALAVHADGATFRFTGWKCEMRSALLIAAAIAALLSAGCDNLSERRVKDAAVLTNGGDARVGRVEIRKYGCNACHEISGVPERAA